MLVGVIIVAFICSALILASDMMRCETVKSLMCILFIFFMALVLCSAWVYVSPLIVEGSSNLLSNLLVFML